MIEIETPSGLARVHVDPVENASAALVLGHGAGGGVNAPDLLAATKAAHEAGLTVALVEQPYRVAGRRSPPRAPVLDAAWTAVVEELVAGPLNGLPLIVGGRSAGARVACRTAEATGAVAVLCLAFPLVPPARKGSVPSLAPLVPPARKGSVPSGAGSRSRQPELDAVGVPVLVVQGERDRFGMPEPAGDREVAVVAGDHGLKADVDAVAAAVGNWLGRLTPTRSAR